MKDNSVKTLFYRFYNTVNMYYSLMTFLRDKSNCIFPYEYSLKYWFSLGKIIDYFKLFI